LAKDYSWRFFEEKLKREEEVEVCGRELNKGGLVVEAPFGMFGFIPGSQLGSLWQKKLESLINRTLKVKVIEADRRQDRLVFSEKQVSEAGKIAARRATLKKLKMDKAYEGVVRQVLPYGLLLEIEIAKGEKIEGLVHISEISWEKIEDLGKLYQEGDSLKVKVLGIEGDKLNLSARQLLSDPWEKLEKKYPKDMPVKGKVTRLASFGALVELAPGIEGLIHISKIPPRFKIEVGDKISCFVESIDQEARRLSLGLVLKEKPIGYK
jgi:small subunit ribosomal protein S1